jgi:RNA polymerase-interacting CarD/CdnL/TRCF family regulator
LRKVIDEEAVKKVVKYLTSGGTEMPKNWNRRFKHTRDKMKTGDIFELARSCGTCPFAMARRASLPARSRCT